MNEKGCRGWFKYGWAMYRSKCIWLIKLTNFSQLKKYNIHYWLQSLNCHCTLYITMSALVTWNYTLYIMEDRHSESVSWRNIKEATFIYPRAEMHLEKDINISNELAVIEAIDDENDLTGWKYIVHFAIHFHSHQNTLYIECAICTCTLYSLFNVNVSMYRVFQCIGPPVILWVKKNKSEFLEK